MVGSFDMGPNKTNVDLFKFLIDKAFTEASLFYTRCSVFLGLQVLFSGFALKELLPVSNSTTTSRTVVLLAVAIGLGISVVWFFVNKKGIKYNRSWLADARRLVESDEYLTATVQSALDNPGLQKASGGCTAHLGCALFFEPVRVSDLPELRKAKMRISA